MECPNCEFQNTPGTKTCVRCQSRLDFVAVDVVPPRAGRGLRWRRQAYRLRGRWRRRSDALVAFVSSVGSAIHPDVDWSMIFWTVIPGLGHMRAGFRRTGGMFLALWCALLLLAVLLLGSGFAWLLGAAALGLHCMVYGLLLARPLAAETVGRRLITGVGVYLALLFGLYGPVLFICRNIVRIVPVNRVLPTEALRNGDVLVGGGRWLRPAEWRRGDLVFYRIESPTMAFAEHVVIQAGFGVDRIIGVGGDLVAYDGTDLTVNAQLVPADMMPIGGLRAMPAMSLRVEPGEVAVLPSALRWAARGPAAQGATERVIPAVARVREANLLSRLWWRLRPWSRFGEIH